MVDLSRISTDDLIREGKRRGWKVEYAVTVTVPETDEYAIFVQFKAEILNSDGVTLKLSNSRIRVLEKLLRRSPSIVNKKILIEAMYQDRIDGGPDTADKILQQAICAIRKQINPTQYYIETVGGNYSFKKRIKESLGWNKPPQL